MKREFKRSLCLLLALVLAVVPTVFAGCSEKTAPAETDAGQTAPAPDTTAQGAAETEPEPEETLPPLDVESADYGGRDFTIITSDWGGYVPLEVTDIVADEITGEVLNDAAYNRNLYMAENFKVGVKWASYLDYNQQQNALVKAQKANDTVYDVALIRGWGAQSMLTNGLFCELDQVEHFDADKPWWSRNSYDSLAIANKHFMAVSDMSTNPMLAVWCVYFNKQMIKDYGLDNPYDMVAEGTWTYDRVFKMAAVVPQDLDMDGVMGCDDRFGISHSNDTTMGMYNSSGIVVAKTDDDGRPYFTFTDEDSMTKQLSILERLYDTSVCYNHHASTMNTKGYDESLPFSEGRILFLFAGVHNIRVLRDMEQEFGILPYPKYDDNQQNYIPSTSGLFLQPTCVPRINSGTEEIGVLMEAFAKYGFRELRPAFYETILQRKVARDRESVVMIDYIFDNLSYDIGNVLNLGNFSIDMITIVGQYYTNLSSYYTAKMRVADKLINKLMESIGEIG